MLFLSKLLPIFVYPLGLTLSLLVLSGAGALLHFQHLKILAFAVVILWVSSTPGNAQTLPEMVRKRRFRAYIQDLGGRCR